MKGREAGHPHHHPLKSARGGGAGKKMTKKRSVKIESEQKVAGKSSLPRLDKPRMNSGGEVKTKWMKGAVKQPGAMTEAAKREGVSNSEYEQEHKHDSGHSGQMARLALTFKKHRPT